MIEEALVVACALARPAEVFRSKPYLCPAGVATIGYGATHKPSVLLRRVAAQSRYPDHHSRQSTLVKIFAFSVTSMAERRLQHRNHVAVVEDTHAFPDAVHRPHRRTDINAGHTEAGRDNGADGAAATQI